MSGILGPRLKVQDRNEFGQRIDRRPEPEDVYSIAGARAQVGKLEIRKMKERTSGHVASHDARRLVWAR